MAKFIYESDRISVLERAYKLKGPGYGIHEQFPHTIEERRKQLYPIIKELRTQGNRTKLVKDRLYVNGKLYTPQAQVQAQRTQRTVTQKSNPNRTYCTVVRNHNPSAEPMEGIVQPVNSHGSASAYSTENPAH